MEKKNKIYTIITIVCTIFVIALCTFAIVRNSKESDAYKFEKEYESLNGIVNDQSKTYATLDIASDNSIIYKTDESIIDVLNNESAIVYFGFSTCPWCRSMIETLIEAAKEANNQKIYYVEIKNIRDSYEYQDSIIPKQIVKGTDSYYKILEFLNDNLDEYYIKDTNGNQYDTGVKRLYTPTVIAVKNGKCVDIHVGTVDSQKDPYTPLNEDQKTELKEIYKEMIVKIN